jgi:hypothetical protein
MENFGKEMVGEETTSLKIHNGVKIKAFQVSGKWFCRLCGLGGIQWFYALVNTCFLSLEGRWNKI